MKARFIYTDKTVKVIDCDFIRGGAYDTVKLRRETVGEGVERAELCVDFFRAKAGDAGWFMMDSASQGTALTYFTERADAEVSVATTFIACCGWNRGSNGYLAIAAGCRCDFGTTVGVKDGEYYMYPRFTFDGDLPDEDIELRLYHLTDASYANMAQVYRNYELTECGCVPLHERCAADPRLARAADSIAVRVRQGWKPVPSPVEYQTPVTEPPVHAACTFERVGDIAEAFRAADIEAEFCLVGWNIGGHDGRFPQIFPPEPKLGGEAALRALIKKVKALGYNIVCHDDATAAYTIADCWDEEYLVKNKDGSLHKRPYCWGGGRPHKICARRQYERFECENQPALAEYGFEGIHYIDVITILPLIKCFDKRHPITRRDAAEWYRKTMKLARRTFGGFSSEGAYDFAISDVDYIMYPVMRSGFEEKKRTLADKLIPFWHIVYHGIVLYNPSTFTLNYAAKGTKNRLRYFEYGGRPLVCYYANFAVNNNWMGLEDFLADTDELLADSVEKIRQMDADYKSMAPERFEFIVNHEEIAPEVYVTVYGNGTRVTVDYNAETVKVERASASARR